MPLHLEKKRHRSTLVIVEHDEYDPLPHFQRFSESLHEHFPISAKKVPGANEAPPQVPRFVLASKNSQMLFFPNRLQLQVEYFGNFEFDPSLGTAYCKRKLDAALHLLQSHAGISHMSFMGVVHSFQISSGGLGFEPTAEIAQAFLQPSTLERTSDPVDMELRLGLAWRQKYFLNYTFKNYKIIAAQMDLTAGTRENTLAVSMSDPSQIDEGIEITVDLNTKLLAMNSHGKPAFSPTEIDELLQSALEAVQTDLSVRFSVGEAR